ncbi:MAG: response regulator transcription factor [Betaproteobacteria bacterium]|jgi:DNA-binding NarL/FixJ family response regulator
MKLLVVDDHPLVRAGLRQALKGLDHGVTVLEAADCGRAFELADLHPDIDLVLLDYQLPDMNGLTGLQTLARQHPELPVVMLSGSLEPQLEQRLRAAGAAGYVSKGCSSQELLRVLRLVLAGGDAVIDPDMATVDLPGTEVEAQADVRLTLRQEEVLRMLLDGCTNKDISRALYISDETTRNHVSAVLKFFGVNSRTQAVVAASRLGYTAGPSSTSSTTSS